MNREIILGKTNAGELVTVEIKLEPLDRSSVVTVDHEHVEPTTGHQRLSIMGTIYDRGIRADSHITGAGQCYEGLSEITKPEPPWTPGEIVELHDLWQRWHLNDMRAGCRHQTNIKYEDNKYGRRIDLDATTAANDCPQNYRFGSAWLYEPLPTEVIERIHVFQRRLKP